MSENSGRGCFVNFHLAITRQAFEFAKSAGSYGGRAPAEARRFSLEKIEPDYAVFSSLIDKVGGPWQWTRRPRYAPENRRQMEKVLSDRDTGLYLLCVDGEAVGYSLVTAGKTDLKTIFNQRTEKSGKILEIENFGFFPEHTGKKYGRHFLPALFKELFNRCDTVYLSSRSTNHGRVIPFYTSLGMALIRQEILPDDLLPEAPAPANDPAPRKAPALRR